MRAVVDSVEHSPLMRESGCSGPGRVKPITYQIDTCCFLASKSALNRIGQGLVSSVSGVGFDYKVAMSVHCYGTRPDMTYDVVRI